MSGFGVCSSKRPARIASIRVRPAAGPSRIATATARFISTTGDGLLDELKSQFFSFAKEAAAFSVSLVPSADDGSLPEADEAPHGHPFPTPDFPIRISQATSAAGSHLIRNWILNLWLKQGSRMKSALEMRSERSMKRVVRLLQNVQNRGGTWLPQWFGHQFDEDDKNPVY